MPALSFPHSVVMVSLLTDHTVGMVSVQQVSALR